MTLYTSNYARHAKDPNAVCISIKAPWWYKGRAYYPLAPTFEMVRDVKSGKIDQKQYTIQFLELLDERKLDPQKVVDDLGDGAIMLCYEKPTDFCHRHIVSWWLNDKLGIQVQEMYFLLPTSKGSVMNVDDFLGDK